MNIYLPQDIKTIEDLSLNAWPSHQMQVYDGWILRFSYFYTHRTNCAEPIGASILPLEEKISYCEKIYKRWGTPCIFKISPLTDPALDGTLSARGYHIEHRVDVMYGPLLGSYPKCDFCLPIEIKNRVDDEWLGGLFSLKEMTNPIHLRIVPGMYDAIPKDEIAVLVRDADGRIAATGLGILDREFIGIYAIFVREDMRRRGIARSICTTLLTEGKRRGAAKAYLQCVSDNAPARALYRSLGLRIGYSCWFRVR